MPHQPLDYMSLAEDRPRGWLPGDVAIAVLAAVVLVANAWLVRETYSDGLAGFLIRIYIGPLANAAMIVASLVIAGFWKLASPKTRLRGFAVAGLVFPVVGYGLLAFFAKP